MKHETPITSAPRGKTIVEILSHIGEQTPSYPNEASISLKPDDSGNLGEDCPVSIIVEELEDGRKTVGGLDSKLQATTSQLTHGAVMEKKDKSADYFGMMATSVEHGRPSSPVSSSRLSVTKTIGDGVLLKRSHSCGEMRRRMVLTEWEVVTTTNTEVIVTETGPTSQQMKKGTSSDNETSGGNVKSGLLSKTRDHDGSARDSRRQTLGIDKNSAGHRRSKSSDDRTRKHIDAATTAEIQAGNNFNDTNDCLISSMEPNEEGDHKSVELFGCDDPENGTAIQQSHQSSEEGKTKPSVSDLPLLETCIAVVQDFLTVNELQHSGSEHTIATYTINKPDLVRSVDADREERWAMGLDADLVLDYMVVDVVEKIRLRAAGSDVNDQDSEDPDDHEQPNKSADEQNLVTDCSEVMFPEQKSKRNGVSLRGEVEPSSGAPHQVQYKPEEPESGIADHQQSTCSDIVNNEVVRDTDGCADERHETQDNLTACPVETTRNDPTLVDRQANAAGDISQPTAKEDEDSEEKEADEAENREAEGEETEEKGMTELNCSTIEKTGHVHELSSNSLQNVEHLNGENSTEGQLARGSVDDDGLSPLIGELHSTDRATCGSEPRVDSSNLLDPKLYLSMTTASDTEIESGSSRTNDECTIAETGHVEKVADEEQVMPVTINVEMMANRQDSTTEYRISDVEVMFKAETLSMLGDEEQNEAEPGPPAPSSDHTQRAVTSTMRADDMGDLKNKTVCVSTATDTSDHKNSENADDPVRSPTSTLEGTPQTWKI